MKQLGTDMDNPFVLIPYESRERFCDRVQETQTIADYLLGGSDVTLISPRRYGKTGLIFRVLEEIQERSSEIDVLYLDIYSSSCVEDFIKIFAEAIVNTLKNKSAISSFFRFLGSIRPVISYDGITGSPKVSIVFRDDDEKRSSLLSIFKYLENRKKKIVVAIDEFQQVRDYPNIKMEALLRTNIQQLKNVRFIFSGSKKHIMAGMFADPGSPFYESSRVLFLDKISKKAYSAFIKAQFEQYGKKIDDDAIDFITSWTKLHTFYTQSLCNHIFIREDRYVSLEAAKRSASQILKENEQQFLEIRNLLTPNQWNFLKAVAAEGEVRQPNSGTFIQKYSIGTPANGSRILKSLLDKELILSTTTIEYTSYSVYNVFLSRWLENH
jgi:hypothetical protein